MPVRLVAAAPSSLPDVPDVLVGRTPFPSTQTGVLFPGSLKARRRAADVPDMVLSVSRRRTQPVRTVELLPSASVSVHACAATRYVFY